MAPDAVREAFLRLIEARSDIEDGRYINIKRIGASGGDGHFSLVFTATDQHKGNSVAVKIFRPDRLIDAYRFQSFCREAILLENLVGHPQILGWLGSQKEFVERVTSTGGIPLDLKFPYFVVELATTNVGSIVRAGAWNAEQKLLAFRDMCKSVQRIHLQGIVHRDIKPDNFLVMANARVKLSDFGCARSVDGNEPALLANYTTAPGDLRYTSPEMHALLHDDDPHVAEYGDVFGLGATLFELFSGAILGIQIYDARFAADLASAMGAVAKRDRRRIYLKFVQNLDAGHPLPSISAYSAATPACIRLQIDGHKSMAALDYQRRLCDFETIFLKIEQCLLVLRNEEKVKRWQRRKDIYKQNHLNKLLRRSERKKAELGVR